MLEPLLKSQETKAETQYIRGVSARGPESGCPGSRPRSLPYRAGDSEQVATFLCAEAPSSANQEPE